MNNVSFCGKVPAYFHEDSIISEEFIKEGKKLFDKYAKERADRCVCSTALVDDVLKAQTILRPQTQQAVEEAAKELSKGVTSETAAMAGNRPCPEIFLG